MNWDSIRANWQQPGDVIVDSKIRQMAQSARERERDMHQSVRRRDYLETGISLLMVPIFMFAGWRAIHQGNWIIALASVVLVACCLYVPWRLRQARKLQPDPESSTSMLAYLEAERIAVQAQFEMLRGILGWYLGPIGFGVILFYFGKHGLSQRTLFYAVFILVLYGVIYWFNQRAATDRIAPRLVQIDEQIRELKQGDPA